MTFFLTTLSLAATLVDVPAPPEPRREVLLAQMTIKIERNSIIRVPAPPRAVRPDPVARWKEKSAPHCVRWGSMAAAMVSSPTTIDIIVRGGTRYRVKLEKSCSAVDFYSGFYVKVTPDGQICKDRDMIHSRAGGECGIDKFRTLVPAK
jgi:hypothetical protein